MPMRLTVKLFAILRERAGVSEIGLDLPEGATVADAARALADRLPGLCGLEARSAYAVNQAYVDAATVLRSGDELALIPPVSGG